MSKTILATPDPESRLQRVEARLSAASQLVWRASQLVWQWETSPIPEYQRCAALLREALQVGPEGDEQ